jgi:carbamoyltransferase
VLRIDKRDTVVFYDKPHLRFERLLETYYAFVRKGLASFLKSIFVRVQENMFLTKLLNEGLAEAGPLDKNKLKHLFPEHLLLHADIAPSLTGKIVKSGLKKFNLD